MSQKTRNLKADCFKLFDRGFTSSNFPIGGRRATIDRYYTAWKAGQRKRPGLFQRLFTGDHKPPEPKAEHKHIFTLRIRRVRSLREQARAREEKESENRIA